MCKQKICLRMLLVRCQFTKEKKILFSTLRTAEVSTYLLNSNSGECCKAITLYKKMYCFVFKMFLSKANSFFFKKECNLKLHVQFKQ